MGSTNIGGQPAVSCHKHLRKLSLCHVMLQLPTKCNAQSQQIHISFLITICVFHPFNGPLLHPPIALDISSFRNSHHSYYLFNYTKLLKGHIIVTLFTVSPVPNITSHILYNRDLMNSFEWINALSFYCNILLLRYILCFKQPLVIFELGGKLNQSNRN